MSNDLDSVITALWAEITSLRADVSYLRNLAVPALATAATANTVVLRDSSAGIAVAALTATTIAASSNATVGGTLGVTGATTLSSTLAVSGTTTAVAINASGVVKSTSTGGGTAAGMNVTAAIPAFSLNVTGAAADNKLWDIAGLPSSPQMLFRAVNDANTVAGNFMVVTRSGTTISDVTLIGTSLTFTGAPTVSGATILSSTLAVTGAVTMSSTLAVTSTVTGTGGLLAPRSSGSAVFALDASGTGSNITIANNAKARPFGNNVVSGKFIINDTATDGRVAEFLTGDALTKVAETTANTYTANAAGTASRVNVYLTSSFVEIENKWGSSRTFNVVMIKSR